jgi:hypothetical protein
MTASMRQTGCVSADRPGAGQNRKTAMVLVGIMLFLIAVSIVTILVKH